MFPDLVAHRGYAARYPENTLVAIEAAIDAGARYVEIDVQISADGHPVLFHDRTLARMCAVGGAVHEKTIRELRALSCGETGKFGARFASASILELAGFAALLAARPRVQAFVEIKRVAIERFGAMRVLEIVLPALEGVVDRCALISFDLPFLATARRAHPIPLGVVVDRWSQREHPLVREIAPEYLFADVDGLPAAGPVRYPAARVAVYEVADPTLARALHARGVELVETFEIGAMIAALGARAP